MERPLSVRSNSGSTDDPGRLPFSSSASAAPSSSILPQLISADYLVHEPVCSGFLLKHCKEQFSEENMLFIVAVDRFRDYFHRDVTVFPDTPWRVLDQEYNLITPEQEDVSAEEEFQRQLRRVDFIPEATWPSRILNREAVRIALVHIWDKFLSNKASYQICIPHSALLMTMRRARYIHIYGREVFAEALLDPLSTIQRDIYPRFLQSEHYHAMLDCMRLLDKKACAKKLKLPRPRSVIWDRYSPSDIRSGRAFFTLDDLVEDMVLYSEFSIYLEKCVADENIKCLRAISIYKESFCGYEGTKSPMENALLIYRYFIAPLSPYEISVSYLAAKEVLRGLAEPRPDLFDAVEKSAFGALQTHFNTYRATPTYANLYKVVVAAGRSEESSSRSSKGPGIRGMVRNDSTGEGGCFACFPNMSSSRK